MAVYGRSGLSALAYSTDPAGSPPGGVWTQTLDFSAVGGTNETGWGGYTARQLITATALTSGATAVRFTIRAGTAASMVIANAYFQYAGGGTYDYSTTPIALTFSGSAGVTIGASATAVSDSVVIALNGNPGVLGVYMSATSSLRRMGLQAGSSLYYKLGSDAATVAASGYTNPGFTYYLDKVEVLI